MALMRAVGVGHQRPAHARVRAGNGEYLIELDVAEFTQSELTVELLGRRLTVRGDQIGSSAAGDEPFCLHELLEESFRLPDDADVDQVEVFFTHGLLEIHAPRTRLAPRPLRIEQPSYRFNPNAEPC